MKTECLGRFLEGCMSFCDSFLDSMCELFRDSMCDSFCDSFRDSFSDLFSDSFCESFSDPFCDLFSDSFCDLFSDSFCESFWYCAWIIFLSIRECGKSIACPRYPIDPPSIIVVFANLHLRLINSRVLRLSRQFNIRS
ncbi:hypothetical protein M153_7824000409 [Pseudoloma neurophilia]|uniref:Uncharacterized protein n=1 Tax=Pseudoloma neurophilia TaxID=146866 RepID=A0A0R0LSS5_9MICR|nr:hypothetical protein M153_7824000409 [Pseudoloma neurophilia]